MTTRHRLCLGYDTRSWRSACVMRAVDLLRPWPRRTAPLEWGESCVVSSVAGLGDLFVQMPLIAGIVAEARRRGCKVRVALRPAHADIGRRCGWDVMPFDNALAEFFKAPGSIRPGELVRRIATARAERPDVWIDLTGNAINALLIAATGAPARAARVTRGGRSFVTHPLPHQPPENEYRNRERVASHLGCALDFSVSDALADASPAPGTVVLALTTACRWRNWPLENFLALVRALPGTQFALTGLSGEMLPEERAVLARLAATPNVTNFVDRLGLDEVISLLAHAAAVVTNDTSCAHIANAFHRPGAVLFGPENSDVWAAPEGLRVFHDRSCPHYPCVQWSCKNQAQWCMAKIAPADVLAHLTAVLDARSRNTER